MASNKNNDILTTVPSMKDLHSIVIPRVAARWNTIAHYMDFEIHEIDIIKKKCRDDPEECCAELFERWIQQRNSWKMLLTILKQIRQLAAVTERIEKDVSQLHFTADLPMLTTESQEVYQQVLKKEKNDPPSFHTSQFNNVRTAFVYLTSNVSRLLQKEDFCIIRRSCLEQINTPGGVQLSSDMVQKIKAANNLNALLDTLAESPYWSWIDLRLLEAMVTASSSSVAKDLLTSYQNGVFSKKLLEVLPNVPNKEVREEYYSKVVSKIKKDLEQITVSDLLEFQSELETVIMDLKGGTCALTRIEEGCIEVHWLVPTHCIDHAYKSACLNRHKFHTLDLQYLQIAAYGKIFDPSTLHPLKTTTVDLPPPTSAVPQVQPTAGALFTSANTSSSASMHQGTNPTVTSSTKGEIERKIPKENLMFVLDDLIRQTKDLLKEFDNNILDKQRDKSVINGVRLLLMVVNSSEFYAAMNYFSINKARRLDSDGDIYYVGEWGEKKIPAALIRQSKSGFSGPDGAQQLTITSIGLFKNLEVIIALGVCGTMDRLGDVIVSSQIDEYEDSKIQGDILVINRAIKCKPGRKIYKTLQHTYETWSFPCTKQRTEHKAKAVLKPMLSGVPLVASAKFREELKSGVNIEAGGLEMEGIGVINGIAIANMKDKIEFVIVKAGCDYADEEKNKEWQPVAAMAAADFVYHQLSKHSWLSDDFLMQVRKYLNEAKQLGHIVQLKHLTVLLVGTSGVGKTSFLKVLQGDDPPEDHKATNARESTEVMIPCKVDIGSDDRWITLTKDKQIAEIKKRLDSKSLKPKPNQLHTGGNENTATGNEAATVSNEDATARDEDALPSSKGVETNKDHHNASCEDDGKITDNHQNETTSDLEVNEAKFNSSGLHVNILDKSALDDEVLNCRVSDKPSETWNILTIIDTAGQPEFINLLPAINKLAKITFVVFDLQYELDGTVRINRGVGNEDKGCDNLSKVHYSNLHAIKCLLSMINHSSGCDGNDGNSTKTSDKFQICLVGTHYDKVIGSLELLKKTEKKIKESINPNIHKLCSMWDFKESIIFKMDVHQKYGKDHDGDIAKTTTATLNAIHEKINEVLQESSEHISTNISLNWLLLELKIKEECEKSKMVYMKREQITDLVREENLEMKPAETELALKYLHNTGFLLYFPEGGQGLSDFVFPDPNYLFERLTALINITRNEKCRDYFKVQELRKKGRLHKSLLHEEISDAEKLFPKEVVEGLLILLEHLKILTLWPGKEKNNAESTTYFMPCVLPSFNLNDLCGARNDEVEPLHIQFTFGMIPRGVFCFLIVALLKEVNIFEKTVYEVYNNLITIQTNTTEIVKIIDRVDSLEITIKACDDGEIKDFLYYQVRHDITIALMNVWKNFELSGTEFSDSSSLRSKPFISNASLSESSLKYGFLCNKCKPKKFIASMTKSGTKLYPVCETCSATMILKNIHTIWFVFKLYSLEDVGTTSTTVTLQWNLPISASQLEIKYLLKYSTSNDAEPSRLEIRSDDDDSILNTRLAKYTVRKLSPNTKYHFQLAMVNELEMEGEYVETDACTEKKSLEDIETDFKEMINNLQKALVDSSVKLDNLLMNLKSCFATKNKKVPLFEMNFFKHATSIAALFKVLNYFWNIYDHNMLALLVDTAKCEEASKIYHEFVDSVDLSAFDLTNYCSDEEALTSPGYKRFQITVGNSDCTGKLVKGIKYMIVDYYKLEKYAITLKEVTKGSIIIVFLASDLTLLYIKNGALTSEFMEKLRKEGIVLFNGVNIKEDTRERDASCAAANGKKERKIPKENLMYVLDDLIQQTKYLLKEFDNNILDKQRDKFVINGVRLLLMVVNPSEFYAAMNYFSKNKARRLDSDGDIYYVGEWGEKKIPAALIRQSKSGFAGPDGAQQLTITSIRLFKNLEVIIALGVCGTMGRLGDVIVSSQIDGCDDGKIQGDDIQIINRAIKCKPGRKIYKTLLDTSETWSFPCTKQGTEHKAKAVLKPMLSGVPLVASAKFREKLISGVNLEAGGLEMEGIGVINGIAIANMKDKIEFVIVKAGCDYADEEKNKEWQPVAAMAATDFVYHQLSKHNWLLESSGDVHTENKQDDASDKSIDQATSDTVRSKEGSNSGTLTFDWKCAIVFFIFGVLLMMIITNTNILHKYMYSD